jgi:hypothetical protein
MTTTDKAVSRITQDSYRVLWQKAKPIVVTIKNDSLIFREKRGRMRYYLPIDAAFRQAVRVDADRVRAEKKQKRKTTPRS